MKKILFLIFFTLSIFNIQSTQSQITQQQTDDYFGMFDNINFTKNYFLNKGFNDPDLFEEAKLIQNSNYSSIITNPLTWRLLYERIILAKTDTPALTDISTFWDSSLSNSRTNTTLPIAIINLEGNYIDPNVISNYINNATNKLVPSTPVQTVKMFAISQLYETVYSGSVNFTIDTNLYFSNLNEAILNFEIDFDDGLGYRQVGFTNTTIAVNYSIKGKKSIRYKLTTSSGTYLSYSSLDVKVVNALQPTFAKSTSAKSSYSPARYEVHYGCDNKLDKPVIIVDGFDPTGENTTNDIIERYREYGFLKNLMKSGYDIVAVTFTNNNDDIKNNAKALKDVITKINFFKEENFENTIIGESMGGLITRVALAEMENDNIDHQTGLYISLDSPHRGANTPLGIQFFGNDVLDITLVDVIDFLLNVANLFTLGQTSLSGTVSDFNDFKRVVRANDSEAAKQMLIRHRDYPSQTSQYYLDFQNFLNNTGFPSYSRNIALINGSNNGDQQRANDANGLLEPNEMMLDKQIGCDCCFHKVNVDIRVSPINTTRKVSNIEIRSPFIPITCTLIKTTDKEKSATFNDKPWDVSPGGVFGTDEVNLGRGRDAFSFVPTVSSIALNQSLIDSPNGTFYYDEDNPLRDKAFLIANNQTPFNDIYSGPFNTLHVSGVSDSDLIELMGEIEEQEFMHEQMYLQSRTIKSGWKRDFEANDLIKLGNNVTPSSWQTGTTEDRKTIQQGDFIIESNAEVDLKAVNSISLLPGFKALSGSVFKSSIAAPVGTCQQPLGKFSRKKHLVQENGYKKLKPIPTIFIEDKNDVIQFVVSNYSDGNLNYKWSLEGEDVSIKSSDKLFSTENLPLGQYSITVDVDGLKKSKVFKVTSKKSKNTLNTVEIVKKENDIIFSNPSSESLNLKLQIEESSYVKISILDINGKLIKVLKEDFLFTGNYEESFDISTLSSGMYLLKIDTEKSSSSKKLIIK